VATDAPTFIPSVSPTPFTATAPLNQTLVVPSSTWVQSLLRVVPVAQATMGQGSAPSASASLAFTARANGSFLSRAFSPRTPGAATESGCSPDLPGLPVLGFHVWPVDVYTPFPSPLYVSVDPSGLSFDASLARVAQCVQQTWELRDTALLPSEVTVPLLPDAPIVVALSVPGISVLVLTSDSAASCVSGRHGCACTRASTTVSSDLPLYTACLVIGALFSFVAAHLAVGLRLSGRKDSVKLRLVANVVLSATGAAFLVAALALYPTSEYGSSAALVSRTRNADGSVAANGADRFLATAYLVAAACAAIVALVSYRWSGDEYRTIVQCATRTMAGVAAAVPSTALAPPSRVAAAPLVLVLAGGFGTLAVSALGARFWPSYRKTVAAVWLLAADAGAVVALAVTWTAWPCETSYYGDTRV
jgi:hypothetical protein